MHIHNKLYGHIYNICIYTDIYIWTQYISCIGIYIYKYIYRERELIGIYIQLIDIHTHIHTFVIIFSKFPRMICPLSKVV